MAITTETVVTPLGMLDRASMFPGDEADAFEARVSGYVEDAVGRTTLADAQMQWVYYRAFMAVHLRLAAMPATGEFVEGGSYSYILTQINLYYQRAQEALAAYNVIIAEPTAVTFRPNYPVTTSFDNVVWP